MDSSHSPDPRRSERPLVELAAVVGHPRSGRRFIAELVELSCEGCRLLTREPMESGDQLLLSVAGLKDWPARVVWIGGEAVGVEFHQPLQPGVVMRYAETFPPHLRVYNETLRLTVSKPVREVH